MTSWTPRRENHGGLLITANNVFPRGVSSVHLESVSRSSVTANRLHSFYPGMVVFSGGSSENLLASNHLLRDHEPWTPFLGIDNGLDDLYGLVRIEGNDNSLIGNHISVVIDASSIHPTGAKPVVIRLATGTGNYVATNHIVARDVHATSSGSAFEAQVDALLSTATSETLTVTTVSVDASSVRNTVLDTGADAEVLADRDVNAVRPTPTI
jgi:inulin fructotransferase (DFA-I-forming)